MVAKVRKKKKYFFLDFKLKKGRATAAPKGSPPAAAEQRPLLAAGCNSTDTQALM